VKRGEKGFQPPIFPLKGKKKGGKYLRDIERFLHHFPNWRERGGKEGEILASSPSEGLLSPLPFPGKGEKK